MALVRLIFDALSDLNDMIVILNNNKNINIHIVGVNSSYLHYR